MRHLIDEIWREFEDNLPSTLLDLGCGDLWFTENLPGIQKHVGVDIWEPYLERALQKGSNGFEAVNDDIIDYIKRTEDNSFDVVVAIDVVEHFQKEPAHHVINNMVRIASKLVIVWTTLGLIEQGEFDNNGEFNPYQAHLSAPNKQWFPEPWHIDIYEDYHGARGGAIFAYRWME